MAKKKATKKQPAVNPPEPPPGMFVKGECLICNGSGEVCNGCGEPMGACDGDCGDDGESMGFGPCPECSGEGE
jgi:hypothetical protein